MKKNLLVILLFFVTIALQAQKDTVNISTPRSQKSIPAEIPDIKLSIYPVPVRENYFNIKSDKEISSVEVTNIIGQNIFRAQYNNPQTILKIFLDNQGRGLYLVTITFSDGARIVRKIMIE